MNTRQQETLMTHCPATGRLSPYPSHAKQWRIANGYCAWLFNPWGGNRRTASDVGTDVFGKLLIPTNEPLYAAHNLAIFEAELGKLALWERNAMDNGVFEGFEDELNQLHEITYQLQSILERE